MIKHAWLVLLAAFALVVAACATPGASTAPSRAPSTGAASTPGAETPAAASDEPVESEEPTESEEPGESPGESEEPGESPARALARARLAQPTGAFDPSTISGTSVLGQWESSPAEQSALEAAVAEFETAYPNIDVQQETIAGDYRAEMITRFGAHNPPDLFYVNAEYAQDWINRGLPAPAR